MLIFNVDAESVGEIFFFLNRSTFSEVMNRNRLQHDGKMCK